MLYKGGNPLNNVSYEQSAIFEHRFWLQILGDHARFIYNALSPKETQEIQKAQGFIVTFDTLLNQARQPLTSSQLVALTQLAQQQAILFREFKLHLLRRQLVEEIAIKLPPTFFNHMLNELEEYILILECLVNQQLPPVFNSIHYHLLWDLDAMGHAESLISNLDLVEKILIEQSRTFSKHFKDLYLKAVEMAGYLRTNLNQFPALSRFNRQVELEILLFMDFLKELKQLNISKEVLGTLMPLMPDHMFREECYFLIKLSQVSEVNRPNCDPTKPRVQE